MAVLQDININVFAQPSDKRLRTFLVLSQNENGRTINFRILGSPLPSSCTATFSGTKPDGTVYSTTGIVTGNFVIVQEDIQMTAVAGVWDAKLDIVNGSHNIMTAIIRVTIERDVVAPGTVPSDSQLDGLIAQAKFYAEQSRIEAYGSPLSAALKADMIDRKHVYVYTGSESGMTAGNWYYWNGSAWTSGGVYNSVAVDTDTTVSISGKAADAAATKALIDDVKEDLNSACFEPYTIVWTKRTIKANGGYDEEGNGATSPRLTSRYEIQLGAGCKCAIRFYADGLYLGKLNTDDTISTTGGTWGYFTGSFNPGKYLDMFSADAYQICVVPTDSTVITDAQTWGNAHVTPHTSKLIDKQDYEKELRAVNHQLIIPCTTQILTGENNEFELSGRLIRIDGTMPQTARNRLSIYNIFDYSSVAPTYAAKPTWYGEPCDAFTVGHKYRFEYMILSGSVDRGSVTEDFYFDLRTVDQTRAGIVSGDEWICTFQPQMIAFCVGQVEFDDCVMYLKILDMTEMESDDPYKVPSYFETQLATAISKINADINSTKTRGEYGVDYEAFVFVTDTHWAANKKHSPALIKRVLDSTPISMVIHGGDVIQYRNATKEGAIAEIRGFMNAITEIPCYEFYNVYGNHDSNSNSTPPIAVSMGKEEEFSVLYAPFAYKNNVHWIWEDEPAVLSEERTKNDYYFDHARTRTRFLCIDWNHPYSDARIGWIRSVLARNDGYRVMVVYHGCYKIDTTTDELVEEHVQIMDIIEPYKAKIVALVTGHAHRDAVFDYYEDGSVPIIITDCDTFRADRMDEETTDEQCIDVYVVDYTNSKIELTRIGRGQDRTVNISVT